VTRTITLIYSIFWGIIGFVFSFEIIFCLVSVWTIVASVAIIHQETVTKTVKLITMYTWAKLRASLPLTPLFLVIARGKAYLLKVTADLPRITKALKLIRSYIPRQLSWLPVAITAASITDDGNIRISQIATRRSRDSSFRILVEVSWSHFGSPNADMIMGVYESVKLAATPTSEILKKFNKWKEKGETTDDFKHQDFPGTQSKDGNYRIILQPSLPCIYVFQAKSSIDGHIVACSHPLGGAYRLSLFLFACEAATRSPISYRQKRLVVESFSNLSQYLKLAAQVGECHISGLKYQGLARLILEPNFRIQAINAVWKLASSIAPDIGRNRYIPVACFKVLEMIEEKLGKFKGNLEKEDSDFLRKTSYAAYTILKDGGTEARKVWAESIPVERILAHHAGKDAIICQALIDLIVKYNVSDIRRRDHILSELIHIGLTGSTKMLVFQEPTLIEIMNSRVIRSSPVSSNIDTKHTRRSVPESRERKRANLLPENKTLDGKIGQDDNRENKTDEGSEGEEEARDERKVGGDKKVVEVEGKVVPAEIIEEAMEENEKLEDVKEDSKVSDSKSQSAQVEEQKQEENVVQASEPPVAPVDEQKDNS